MPDVSILGGLAQDATVQRIASLTPTNVFRDGMSTMDNNAWDYTTTRAASDLVYVGGNTASASWVSICKSALVPDTYTEFVSRQSWPLSAAIASGISISQRMQGQEFAFDLVGVDADGSIINNQPIADTQLGTTASANGSLITFNTITPHNLLPGDVISIYGAQDPRFNFGPATVATWVSATSFTISSTYGSATYTMGSNAYVRFVPPDAYATYTATHRFWGTSSQNVDAVSKNAGRMPETVNWNPVGSATDATYPSENGINYSGVNYSYSQRARYEFNIRLHSKYSKFFVRAMDSASTAASTVHRTHNIPDASRTYKMRFRGRNLPNLIVPVGPITAATKSASTTATLTIPNHGLTTSDYIYIYGIRDQTNFANQGTAVIVASVPNANTITVAFGASATASSYGGFVLRNQGSAGLPGLGTGAIQQYARTADAQRLLVTFNGNPSTPAVGEIWTLFGLVDSTNTALTALYGRYQVAYTNSTTFQVELVPMDGQVVSGLSATNTAAGGTLIRNTEMRVHFVRAESEQNTLVEIMGGEGDQDFANALPVAFPGNSAVNVNQIMGSSPASMVSQASARILGTAPTAVVNQTDRASSAATATGNTGTIADDFGNALSGQVTVTATAGTSPRMDVALQESFDNGTTWQDIFHLPRITANGTYLAPYQLIGGRRRWNYTIGGTSPSFTFAIFANKGALAPSGILRNFFDYTSNAGGTINVNTLNSTTPSWFVEGCKEYSLAISMGAVITTAPAFQLQMSPDNVNWFNVGTPITATASTNTLQSYSNTPARYMRVLVSTAGSGATTNFINISGR